MSGAHKRIKPGSPCEPSVSDEKSRLELHLQRQLEDDIARIFDESIYSDIEVGCDKLKILTHTCILKARTNTFYHKLQSILHVNIGRNTFDEIYSFVSDAYTECDIEHQEREIITYLDNNLKVLKTKACQNKYLSKNEESEEPEVYLTPKCISPPEKGFQKSISSSPSTELSKEYDALVPVDTLEKELKEQDLLSNALQNILKSQIDELKKIKALQCTKPTSLSLSCIHTSKTVKHSNSCDTLIKCLVKDPSQVGRNREGKKKVIIDQSLGNTRPFETNNASNQTTTYKIVNNAVSIEKAPDSTFSPDSLITDEPSSSSDYLSAAYTFSPGVTSSACLPHVNGIDSFNKMDNIITSSDSGLENTGILESLNSHVTLTDLSLTESGDDTNDSQFLALNSNNQKMNYSVKSKDSTNANTSKEVKQRQNEENLESSSLSSETGSWESAFPPKLPEKEICEKFLNIERQYSVVGNNLLINTSDFTEGICPSLVQKSPFKSTSCFIDAATLVDEEEEVMRIQNDLNEIVKSEILPATSQPAPCSTVKSELSPNDWSDGNDNDDSLEQGDGKDPESIQKDILPTNFEMFSITEDLLCGNNFETTINVFQDKQPVDQSSLLLSSTLLSSTPQNSMLSCKAKHYEWKNNEIEPNIKQRERQTIMYKQKKYDECSPIISGGASIDDHLPQPASTTASPVTRRKVENMPIVSGAYTPSTEENYRKSPKPTNAAAWIVDMSSSSNTQADKNEFNIFTKKPGDKMCENLRKESNYNSQENCNKSRSSVDSDSSERSSHKFYIDLSSLPNSSPQKKDNHSESVNEKKNMFSIYIDLNEDSIPKEMPARLSSSINTKKINSSENKNASKCPITESKCLQDRLHNNNVSTFEKLESLCNDPTINLSEIIAIPKKVKHKATSEVKGNLDADVTNKKRILRNVDEKLNIAPVIQEELFKDQSIDLFVKLSDLDKPAPKAEYLVAQEKVMDVRMTRSIPDNDWGVSSHNVTSRSIEVSRFYSENTLSLSRLFPQLKNELSKSMPGSLSCRTKSPLSLGNSSRPSEIDEQASDLSEISSARSSICRSVLENSTSEDTTQMSRLIGNCQSRLGQDLLKMFLEEIVPDVIVEVSGRRIRAHKCILSSRCQYFAGILSGGWVESAGNVIILPPFSPNVVHFALCHIYSGVSSIPDSISIVELATLADMLGLEGLKEAIMFTLKAKYCHNFHKPCAVCTAGVFECFPLSSVYGLDDLYRKCLRWITKHFSKVWPTKAFATLPKELLEKCYQQHIINMSIENLVETVHGCGIIVSLLPRCASWATEVIRLCQRLLNASAYFAAPRLFAVLQRFSCTPSDGNLSVLNAFDDCLASAIEWAPPDELCRAYAFLTDHINQLVNVQNSSKPDLIFNGNQNIKYGQKNLLSVHSSSWRLQCEGALVRAAPRAVVTQAFKDLPSDLRKRLRELGCIMYGTQVNNAVAASPLQYKKSVNTYHSRQSRAQHSTSRSLDINHVRNSFVPYASKPIVPTGFTEISKSNNDLQYSKKAPKGVPPKVRTTKAQEERAKFNLNKKKISQDRLSSTVSKPRGNYLNAKPRYLDSRMCREDEYKATASRKLMPKLMGSSSESSCNSSPIQARYLRCHRAKSPRVREPCALSQDSLATSSRPRTAEPSTDSLSESHNSNKYATYTKGKHTTGASSEAYKLTRQSQVTTSNKKGKTKIPIYVKQNSKFNAEVRHTVEPQKQTTVSATTSTSNATSDTQYRVKTNIERKMPGSLMNATKSSSAKMVTKIVKELKSCRTNTKRAKGNTNHLNQQDEECTSSPIPVMERSGTFLKDEPTFGDKTTNLDIDQ